MLRSMLLLVTCAVVGYLAGAAIARAGAALSAPLSLILLLSFVVGAALGYGVYRIGKER